MSSVKPFEISNRKQSKQPSSRTLNLNTLKSDAKTATLMLT